MTRPFTEDEFEKTLVLMERQPWLRRRRREYLDLLKEFPNPELRSLIIDLLQETIWIDLSQYFDSFNQIKSHVENDWDIDFENCVFVSANGEGRIASSHEALHQLRNESWEASIAPGKFVNKFSEAAELLTEGGCLIIVDDFVGSGGTICKVIDWFEKEFEKAEKTVRIFVVTVSGCREGIERLTEKAADCFCAHRVPKGISDRWSGDDLTNALSAMDEMENQLQERSRRSIDKFRLGWGRQEAVFYRERGSTPNNVFPIFWWTDMSSGSRDCVMVRR